MTSVTPLTREELLELAPLDAMGLLDEYDAALFARSFHQSPPSIQREILEQQADLAAAPPLLPSDEPPADLRGRVLASVRAAMDREAAKLSPIATIGRRADLGHGDATTEGHSRRSRAANAFWRAASFALATSLLVVLYFNAEHRNETQETLDQLTRYFYNGQVQAELEARTGPQFRRLMLDGDCSVVAFKSEDGDDRFGAFIVHGRDDEAYVVFLNLPANAPSESYRLHIEGGDVSPLEFSLDSTGTVAAILVEQVSYEAIASASLRVVDAGGNLLGTFVRA